MSKQKRKDEELAATPVITFSPVDAFAECSVKIPGGYIVSPAYPADCLYIRLVDEDGQEHAYWDHTEFGDDPLVVLGALMGAAKGMEGLL